MGFNNLNGGYHKVKMRRVKIKRQRTNHPQSEARRQAEQRLAKYHSKKRNELESATSLLNKLQQEKANNEAQITRSREIITTHQRAIDKATTIVRSREESIAETQERLRHLRPEYREARNTYLQLFNQEASAKLDILDLTNLDPTYTLGIESDPAEIPQDEVATKESVNQALGDLEVRLMANLHSRTQEDQDDRPESEQEGAQLQDAIGTINQAVSVSLDNLRAIDDFRKTLTEGSTLLTQDKQDTQAETATEEEPQPQDAATVISQAVQEANQGLENAKKLADSLIDAGQSLKGAMETQKPTSTATEEEPQPQDAATVIDQTVQEAVESLERSERLTDSLVSAANRLTKARGAQESDQAPDPIPEETQPQDAATVIDQAVQEAVENLERADAIRKTLIKAATRLTGFEETSKSADAEESEETQTETPADQDTNTQ